MVQTYYYTFQLHSGGSWHVARNGIVISEWHDRKDAKRIAELLENERNKWIQDQQSEPYNYRLSKPDKV